MARLTRTSTTFSDGPLSGSVGVLFRLSLVLVACLLAASCSMETDGASAAEASVSAKEAGDSAQVSPSLAWLSDNERFDRSDPGTLVIYSGRSESLVAPVIRQFREATRIDVQVKYGASSAVAATLMEEGENSVADVFWSQESVALAALSKVFEPLPPELTDSVPDWARSGDGRWVGISGRARVLIYSSGVQDSELPVSIEDLTGPEWKGRVAWAPNSASFRAMVTAMRHLWGEDRTRAWLKGMVDNDIRVYPKNTPIVDAAGKGEVDLGLVNHYYVHRFLAEQGDDFGARNLFLKDGGPASLVMVAGAGIPKTSPNRENAELFLRFLLSRDAQQYFADSVYEYPLIQDVETHPLLPPIDSLNGPEIDFALLDDLTGTEALLREVGAIP